MPEVGKHTVVIASILKPVDDTRSYEKIGRTLAGTGLYNVHVIGSGQIPQDDVSGIHFHSLGIFERLSWKRWTAAFRVLTIVRKLRPELVIVTTHELLWVAVYAKLLQRALIIYDIQENYFLNIRHTDAFPRLTRWPIGLLVRLKEIMCSRFFDMCILAEKVYARQLKFTQGRSVVLENKAVLPATFKRNPGPATELLFSGTLAKSTGVFEAIHLASLLHAEDNNVRLHIIGYCASEATRMQLSNEVRGKAYVTLTSSDHVQPHASIIQAISRATFGVVCYPPSLHTAGAFPTKAYEYLACGLPVLFTKQWAPLFEPYNAGVLFEKSMQARQILSKMKVTGFYTSPPNDVLWEKEGSRLLDAIRAMIERQP